MQTVATRGGAHSEALLIFLLEILCGSNQKLLADTAKLLSDKKLISLEAANSVCEAATKPGAPPTNTLFSRTYTRVLETLFAGTMPHHAFGEMVRRRLVAAASLGPFQRPAGGPGPTGAPFGDDVFYSTNFEQVLTLGKGGYGRVYLVRSRIDRSYYAVKAISVPLKGDRPNDVRKWQKRLRRILSEIRILSDVSRSGRRTVVRYQYGWIEPPSVLDLVMPDEKTGSLDVAFESPSSCSGVAPFSAPAVVELTSSQDAHITVVSKDRTADSSGSEEDPSEDEEEEECQSSCESEGVRRFFHNEDGFLDSKSALNNVSTAAVDASAGFGDVLDSHCDFDESIECESPRRLSGLEGGQSNKFSVSTTPNVRNSVSSDDERDSMIEEDSLDESRISKTMEIVPWREGGGGMTRLKQLGPGGISHLLAQMKFSAKVYILMEYCGMYTLRDWIQEHHAPDSTKSPVSFQEIGRLFAQVVDAIAFVHSIEVLHRDLKPENIFLSSAAAGMDVEVKVGDFGLARFLHQAEAASRNTLSSEDNQAAQLLSSNVGTAYYAAPEQLQGSHYNSMADMYSLGLVLFEMCVALGTISERVQLVRALFGGNPAPRRIAEGSARARTSARAEVAIKTRKRIDELHPLLFDLLERLLSVDPGQRPTALEVLAHPCMKEFQRFVQADAADQGLSPPSSASEVHILRSQLSATEAEVTRLRAQLEELKASRDNHKSELDS